MMKRLFQFAILVGTISMTSCVAKFSNKTETNTVVADSLPWYEDMDALQADLNAAIEDARVLDSTKVGVNLMPIKKGTPNEEWLPSMVRIWCCLSRSLTVAACRSSLGRKVSIRLTARWVHG